MIEWYWGWDRKEAYIDISGITGYLKGNKRRNKPIVANPGAFRPAGG